MSSARLAAYLRGGVAPGGKITHVGARDATLPMRSMPITLPGTVFFAGESRVWGGGRAYYDPTIPGSTPARAYLITAEQFDDVRAQEPPVYDRILELGVHDGIRMLTFSSELGRSSAALNPPSQPYLETIATGIREAHGWDTATIQHYFDGVTKACSGGEELR
ncbi:hypothetical protein [Antrihabitans cavernicola]|uniref:Uncharacterized protein n=1 Tax=Antrihabitans cavernicola TaxID=2495913 RepID=A0A5A7SHE0_9NOCA|nr:hypothetical protein [Spelaeibacter cavernicola]KAA0024829.1 hypothetical protein FOY51_02550 [Spelaeibacter cavernicola]